VTLTRPVTPWEFAELSLDGRWCEALSTEMLGVRDPTTLETVGRLPLAGVEDAERAVATSRRAFDAGPWPSLPLDERMAAVERLGDELAARREELVRAVVAETGLPVGGTVLSGTGAGQVDGALALIAANLETVASFPFSETVHGRFAMAHVSYEPVGVVVAIVPWNGPLWSALMKLIPAVLAGNVVLLKPSPLAPLDAMILAQCVDRAGFPPGVITVVPGDVNAGVALVGDPRVDKVSFTGSTTTGRDVARLCTANLTRFDLELGGKSAAIVLDDADLDATLPVLVCGGLDNNGESCTALTRILVCQPLEDELVDRVGAAVTGLRTGDPFDPTVDVGPLITEQQRSRAEAYIAGAEADGARVVAGGSRPGVAFPGWFLEPTILAGVRNDMPVARDEIFAPVLSVIACRSEDEAVAVANDSPYGLSGAVFSAEADRAMAVCRRIRTGTINVNGFTINIDAPLGGFKWSGMGREYGVWGLREFVEAKTVNVPGP
jgi:acyl-CoA reductase-like NAD-dependent aldehyde dehydrogenase